MDTYRIEPIIAKLDSSIPLQAAHIAAMRDMAARGLRYANEDSDIRGAALAAVGKSEVAPWNARWVDIWASRA